MEEAHQHKTLSAAEYLAAKYNVPVAEVERLIAPSQTDMAASEPRVAQAGLNLNEAEARRPNGPDSSAKNSETIVASREWNVSPMIVILGVITIVGLVLLFRACGRHEPPPSPVSVLPDTTPAFQEPLALDTAVLFDTVMTPAPEPPKPMPVASRPPRRARTSRSAARPEFTSTSSFAAQERLAELRAEGNAAAKLRTRTKNGVTVYEVVK